MVARYNKYLVNDYAAEFEANLRAWAAELVIVPPAEPPGTAVELDADLAHFEPPAVAPEPAVAPSAAVPRPEAATTAAAAGAQPRLGPDERLGRPNVFSGAGAQAETEWSDFSFKAQAYFGLEGQDTAMRLKAMEEREAPAQVMADYNDVGQQLAVKVYFGLVMLTSHQALRVVKTVTDSNGFEAYRRLSQRFNPASGGRTLGRLSRILRPDLGGDAATLLDKLTAWEQEIHEYDAVARDRLGDQIKTSILLQNVPEAIRVHLTLSVTDTTPY